MGVSKRHAEYVRAHYARHGDEKLARALGVDRKAVRKVLAALRLNRTKAEREWIRQHPDEPLPAYTAQALRPAWVASLTWMDLVVALACAAVAMAVYVRTLGPTVTGEDSGELVTAAYTMGIAHPPGYPLWCILGKLFTVIVPFGNIAWRVNLMSAFFGAATVFVVALMVVKLTRNRLAAVGAALALAFSAELWEQCVIAEVYSLNAFLVALCAFLLLVWYERRGTWLLLVFAVVYGLGLCNHNTMHFLAPLFGGFILVVDREPWRRWYVYVAMAALVGLAWLTHLYLPIRSLANPPVDWGNPETWEGFWAVITREQYKFMFTADPRTPARFFTQCGSVLKLYAAQFTPALALLPLFGFYPLWKRDRYRFALVAGAAVYLILGFILILNSNMDRESVWISTVFYIPGYVFLAVLMGCAIDWLARLSKSKGAQVALAALLAAVAALVPLAFNLHQNDRSEYYFSRDFTLNILNSLDEDAIYFPTADHATFPALYLQAVEGVRPDVTIANKYGYPEESVYADMPVEIRNQFGKIPTEGEEAVIEDWVIANTDRPVYFTKKRPIRGLPGATMVNAGLVYRVMRPGEELPDRDWWSEYTWHTLDEADTRGEYTAELILSDYHYARGRSLLDQEQFDEGLEELDTAIRLGGASREAYNNVGSVCAEHGQVEAAINYYEKGIELDPEYDMVLRNLAKLSLQQGDPARAADLFCQVLELRPQDAEAHWLRVRSLVDSDQIDEAIVHLGSMTEFAPDDPAIYRELGMIYLTHKRDREQANRYFAKSLQLNPDQRDVVALMRGGIPPGLDGQQPQMPNMPQLPNGIPGMPNAGMPQLPQLPAMPGQ